MTESVVDRDELKRKFSQMSPEEIVHYAATLVQEIAKLQADKNQLQGNLESRDLAELKRKAETLLDTIAQKPVAFQDIQTLINDYRLEERLVEIIAEKKNVNLDSVDVMTYMDKIYQEGTTNLNIDQVTPSSAGESSNADVLHMSKTKFSWFADQNEYPVSMFDTKRMIDDANIEKSIIDCLFDGEQQLYQEMLQRLQNSLVDVRKVILIYFLSEYGSGFNENRHIRAISAIWMKYALDQIPGLRLTDMSQPSAATDSPRINNKSYLKVRSITQEQQDKMSLKALIASKEVNDSGDCPRRVRTIKGYTDLVLEKEVEDIMQNEDVLNSRVSAEGERCQHYQLIVELKRSLHTLLSQSIQQPRDQICMEVLAWRTLSSNVLLVGLLTDLFVLHVVFNDQGEPKKSYLSNDAKILPAESFCKLFLFALMCMKTQQFSTDWITNLASETANEIEEVKEEASGQQFHRSSDTIDQNDDKSSRNIEGGEIDELDDLNFSAEDEMTKREKHIDSIILARRLAHALYNEPYIFESPFGPVAEPMHG